MKAYFGRRYMLSASHRLHAEALTPEQNRAAYGKCNNPHGHGHNYVVEVLVGGQVQPETGMVISLVDLDAIVRTQIMRAFRSHQSQHRSAVYRSRAYNGESVQGRLPAS